MEPVENDDDSGKPEIFHSIHPTNISSIKNKVKRTEKYIKMQKDKIKTKRAERKKRKKEREALGDKAPPLQTPKTIESMREPDETIVNVADEEVQLDEATDELANYFKKEKEPKILITSSEKPHTRTFKFCKELAVIIPNSVVIFRRNIAIKKLIEKSKEKKFTDIIVINEDRRVPNALLLIHLPEGPTAYFKLSNVKLVREMKKSYHDFTSHRPEVILNNFNTRLGHRVGRLLAALFHYDPQFKGRRAVTFHNQRDYIFFRNHRYEFRNEKKVGLKELGPRFTMRLRSLQKGTFDTKFGEFEWVLKRHEMESSRRRFVL